MKICGFNKTTLLDYPGRVACTIFLGGCNFRCPFCQNGGLVERPEQQPEYSREEILSFLKKRKGILDGVCISGGEPTLSPALGSLLPDIKSLGYSIKLDTNGSRPDILKSLAKDRLIDMIAMDIKTSPGQYSVLTGIAHPDLNAIYESVDFLMSGTIDYEFRTTVVKELHTERDFHEIGMWLKGAKSYYLQAYRDSEEVLQPGFSSYSQEELMYFRSILLNSIPLVEIRGID